MSFIGNDARRRRRRRPEQRVAMAAATQPMQKIVGHCLLPSPVATSAWNEALVGGFLSSEPSFSLSSLLSGRPAFGGRDGGANVDGRGHMSAKLVTFQSCNALWTHAPTSRAVNLRTTRLFIIEEYERLGGCVVGGFFL